MSRKFITAAVLAAALGATVVTSATPANAFTSGEAAAIGLGAFAVGAIASGAIGGGPAYHPYHVGYYDCHFVTRPRFNAWGDVVGYRQMRVCH